MMLITIMEEATTNTMVITIMVDSGETMEDIDEMDMLVITITMDSITQILNQREISVKCFVSSATTRAIMPMSARKED